MELYEYKDNTYTVLFSALMKLPDCNWDAPNWTECIVYQDDHGNKYVRSSEQFYGKFKLVIA